MAKNKKNETWRDKAYRELKDKIPNIEEEWKKRMSSARSLYFMKSIKLSYQVYESFLKDIPLTKYSKLGEKTSKREFRESFFSKSGEFTYQITGRFEKFINYNGNILIAQENEETGELELSITDKLFEKLEGIYSYDRLLTYDINDLFEDFQNNVITYKELIENIKFFKENNEEILARNYGRV